MVDDEVLPENAANRMLIGNYFIKRFSAILKCLNALETKLRFGESVSDSDWASLSDSTDVLLQDEMEALLPIARSCLGHESSIYIDQMAGEHRQIRVWLAELRRTDDVADLSAGSALNRCRQVSRFLRSYQTKMRTGLYHTIDSLGYEVEV